MLSFGRPRAVWLGVEPVDLRKGLDGLHGIVKEGLGQDPASGGVFVFTNARRNRLRLIFFDGTGYWCCTKRLEKGGFRWPRMEGSSSVEVSSAQLGLLFSGLEPTVKARPGWWRGMLPAVSGNTIHDASGRNPRREHRPEAGGVGAEDGPEAGRVEDPGPEQAPVRQED